MKTFIESCKRKSELKKFRKQLTEYDPIYVRMKSGVFHSGCFYHRITRNEACVSVVNFGIQNTLISNIFPNNYKF